MQQVNSLTLLVVDGIGLSSSSQGNALLAANPANFSRFWQEYPHAALRTVGKGMSQEGYCSNPEVSYALMNDGNLCLPNLDTIDRAIKDGSLYSNKVLTGAFEYAKNHFASVHLVGTISNNRYESSLEHLESLMEMSERMKFYQVYLHLILDGFEGDGRDVLPVIERIEKKLLKSNIGKIVSYIGSNHIGNTRNKQSILLRLLTERRGESGISGEQLLLRHGFDVKNLSPSCIISRGMAKGGVSDFDVVIFFSHLLDRCESAATALIDRSYSSLPKMVKVVTLVPPRDANHPKLNVALEQEYSNTLIDRVVAHGMKTAVISESSRMISLSRYLIGLNGKVPESIEFFSADFSTKKYYKDCQKTAMQIINSWARLIKNQFKGLIIVDLPCVDVVSRLGGFKDTVTALQFVDSLLPQFEKTILSSGNAAIFTSNYGRIENLSASNGSGLKVATSNPVPMVLISDEKIHAQKTKVSLASQIMTDLLNVKHDLSDLPVIIEKVLDIDTTKSAAKH
ncbi:MAG: 2,3-bisphosphoglycerate-independent phosphoglycerate mutase [bacterium ADurb.Bin400]|nr:MAG: 2,3-bisphosphoglycerate-independent phosphoglycerate mutase [bacterium ADurb.Bin400]